MCLLTLLAKIKFSRKFPNLQYNTQRILGESLMISSLPGKALRMLVETMRLAEI